MFDEVTVDGGVMVVLVTGAAGFIGSHVVKLLLEKGYQVRATARSIEQARFLGDFSKSKSSVLEIVKMDLLKPQSVNNAVNGCTAVIHCAAALMIDVKDAQKDVVDPSVIGTQNLCSAIEKHQSVKSVIHTSSVAAIRRTRSKNGQVFNADDWCDDATLVSNPYGMAKAEAEQLMRAFVEKCEKTRKIRLITIHPSIVFGPVFHKKHLRGSMAYLNHYLGRVPFVLNSHLNFVDVRDVALAHVHAMDMGQDKARYILHSQGMWMNEIGKVLRKVKPGRRWPVTRLPAALAMVMAAFHPKLTVKQVRSTIGRHVDYDVGGVEESLNFNFRSMEDTLADSIDSLDKLRRKV